MYSGENELARCISAIRTQRGVEINHYIVRNKREIEAHCDLYTTWNGVKNNFDMFVQIDADTVLYHPTLLFEAHTMLQLSRELGYTSLQYPLLDMLTEQQILGLNCYGSEVGFNVPNDEVYCDRSTSNNKTRLLSLEGGYHSPDPTYQQAFHFGLHRGLKNQEIRWAPHILGAWRSNGDDRRLLALLGFKASVNFVNNRRTSYSDEEFSLAYVDACEKLPDFRDSLK
jgi:hypothetical protein